MKFHILLFMLLSLVTSLEAQQSYGNSHNNHASMPSQGQGVQSMASGDTLFVRISDGTIAFHGARKTYEPVELTLSQGDTVRVAFRSHENYPQQVYYSVQLSGDGRQVILDSDSRAPVLINNVGWVNGCSYSVSQNHPNSRMMPDSVGVYVKTVRSAVQAVPQVPHNSVPHQSYPAHYGDSVVTVIIEGGKVAFYGKRKNYHPVAFDIACGERKEVEFTSTDKYPRKAKFWMRLSEDGNSLYVDDGQRKEIVLINHDWEHGQMYHPKERDDHGSRMEALGISISVRNKSSRSYKPHFGSQQQPQHMAYRGSPVTVIVEGGKVAFWGKRKNYHPVAFDIYPGESKKVEFVSTDKYPRKMSYLMELSDDGNTLSLDADQRKAIILINRNWNHGEVYHPEERDDHGSRMEALGIQVTVRQKGKKHH